VKYTTALKKIVTATGFVIYLYALIKLILFKWGSVDIHFLLYQLKHTLQNPNHIFDRPGNFTPFKEISRGIDSLSIFNPFSSTNLIGNVLAFIPLGVFIPKLLRSGEALFIKVFLFSLTLSLCFEVTQLLLFMGTFDVDDLILNTLGGIAGYLAFRMHSSSVKYFAVK